MDVPCSFPPLPKKGEPFYYDCPLTGRPMEGQVSSVGSDEDGVYVCIGGNETVKYYWSWYGPKQDGLRAAVTLPAQTLANG